MFPLSFVSTPFYTEFGAKFLAYPLYQRVEFSYYEKIGDTVTCIDEELPFELPDGWVWVRLETCCQKEIKRGKSPKYVDSSNTLVFAQKCNTKYDGINMDLALYLDESTLMKYPDDEYASSWMAFAYQISSRSLFNHSIMPLNVKQYK